MSWVGQEHDRQGRPSACQLTATATVTGCGSATPAANVRTSRTVSTLTVTTCPMSRTMYCAGHLRGWGR